MDFDCTTLVSKLSQLSLQPQHSTITMASITQPEPAVTSRPRGPSALTQQVELGIQPMAYEIQSSHEHDNDNDSSLHSSDGLAGCCCDNHQDSNRFCPGCCACAFVCCDCASCFW
jgi:hypothetical protein